jgi:hypothetical protein
MDKVRLFLYFVPILLGVSGYYDGVVFHRLSDGLIFLRSGIDGKFPNGMRRALCIRDRRRSKQSYQTIKWD